MSDELARARELLRLRRPEQAIAAALQHLAHVPDDATAHRLIALAHIERDDDAAALASAQTAVRHEPDAVWSHYVLALVHANASRLAPARSSAEAALRADGEHAASHDLMSRLLLAQKDRAGARAAAERALQLDPDRASYHASHARALRSLGHADAARASVLRGLRQAPGDVELQLTRGNLLLAQGDGGAAADAFLSVLRQTPGDETARRGLLEALRARHPGYRYVLMLRQGVLQLARKRHWSPLILSYLACAVLAAVIAGTTGTQVLRAALVAVLLVPKELANLLLLLHPLGRRVLRRREITFAVVIGSLLVAAAGLGTAGWLRASQDLHQAAQACGGGALFAAILHFALEHSRFRRTTKILLAVLVLLVVGLAIYLAWSR